ncbi:suppressor of cytokine signaling 7-like [Varroa destructor]|uniref:Suppressor of cytokine signaling 7 n=1 Tax=Varroa destructor TaxID=109461 RepID=A0A7M7KJB5_VARDE|nr:suppressor of cytokine signaling 7-like [Varroa destructor]
MVLSSERLERSCERSAGRPLGLKEGSGGKMATEDGDDRVSCQPEATRSRSRQQELEHQSHQEGQEEMQQDEKRPPAVDYAASIEKVKDCGWYWGPISGAVAERLLLQEPDGSFLLRDSSDEHHIFSLSFRLSGEVKHVRIEQHGGNFSFGFTNKFHSKTIIEFIENAVEHSRSGRYLFFLNLMPMAGPVRVQLLYPVSRLKRMSSLQHLCRLTVFKVLRQRRDLIPALPLPARLHEYLDTPTYLIEDDLVDFFSEPTKEILLEGDREGKAEPPRSQSRSQLQQQEYHNTSSTSNNNNSVESS